MALFFFTLLVLFSSFSFSPEWFCVPLICICPYAMHLQSGHEGVNVSSFDCDSGGCEPFRSPAWLPLLIRGT